MTRSYAQNTLFHATLTRVRAVILLLASLVLAGCAGDLSQSFKQSLSIIDPENINFSELEYYAKRSKAAYDPISDIRKTFPLTTRAFTVSSVDVRYFIETDRANGVQTLSIRGTAEKPNVWEDVETALVQDSILGIALHRGFEKDADAVFADAKPHLDKSLPLRVTGHSLGGAVALILAAYFEKDGFTVERVVTFGQPRISPQPVASNIEDITTRVVNNLDVVPMVPPYTAVKKYQHFSAEVILREGPDYVYLDEHDSDRLSIGEFWRDAADLSAKDHHMDGYLANIQGKVKNGARQVPYLFEDPAQKQSVAATN